MIDIFLNKRSFTGNRSVKLCQTQFIHQKNVTWEGLLSV